MTLSTASQQEQTYLIPIGTKIERCEGCGKPIFKLDRESGVKLPVEFDGKPHLPRCIPRKR